jgi:lipopolysaccharide transport system ATP-binding protein
MTGFAVRTEGLGKRYVLGQRAAYDTLGDALSRAIGRVRGRPVADGASERRRIWAIEDVDLEIEPGQVVGLIGPNGAGKSTLLKVLSRITEPTVGRAEIAGRVGSLLEVGTGFHPELTGRENIFLNGAILGMKRAEITHRFDEIVAFAEIDRFLDTPVKHYSDGMYLRLAFAVAAHLEPEILLVDEVLAVGDARFQRKCMGKMSDIAGGTGRTVILVSHNLSAIQRLCDRTILIEGGHIVEHGPTASVIARYLDQAAGPSGPTRWIDVSAASRRGTGEARFTKVRYSAGDLEAAVPPYPDGPLEFEFELDANQPITVPSFGVVLSDSHGTRLVNADILGTGEELRLAAGRNRVRLTIDAVHLNAGAYDVTLWAGDTTSVGYDLVESAFRIEISAVEGPGYGGTPGSEYGMVTCHVTVTS